jgi:protein N-terminal methyltransferase
LASKFLTTQPVPHIDQLSSRLFLLSVLPQLHTFPTPLTPTPPARPAYRLTALDVGAGIGRVTNTVLLPLVDDVVLSEPVEHFIAEARRAASAGEWRDLPRLAGKIRDEEDAAENARRVAEHRAGRGKRVWFVRNGLQGLDPALPMYRGENLGVVGEAKVKDNFGKDEAELQYDV